MSRSVEEICGYLRSQVNRAVCRLGMYGDEASLILLFDALAYAEGLEAAWAAERVALGEREAFTSTGVRGALQSMLPEIRRGDSAIASVYAEFAHRVGWLDLDRALTDAELHELIRQIPDWCRHDSALSEVEARFGPPSLLVGGTNPAFSKTWVYAAGSDQPVVCFHLWNRFSEGGSGTDFPEPILLATRIGGQPFAEAFQFTPRGTQLRPAVDEPGS